MRRRWIIWGLFIGILLLLVGGFYVASDGRAKDWIKFHALYPEYLRWKRQGGPWLERYSEPLGLDRYRDEMIGSLSYEEIRGKFPFLVEGETLPDSSYKGQYLVHLRHDSPDAKVLWFRVADGFDWCVVFDGGKARIELIKG